MKKFAKTLLSLALVFVFTIPFLVGCKSGEATKHTLTVGTNNVEYGVVTGSGEYAVGEDVTIQATANDGYYFASWSDGETEENRTFKMPNEDLTLTAIFKEGKCVKYNGHKIIVVNGTIEENENCFTLNPNNPKAFGYWYQGEDSSNLYDTNNAVVLIKSAINSTITLTAVDSVVGYVAFAGTDAQKLLDLEDAIKVNNSLDYLRENQNNKYDSHGFAYLEEGGITGFATWTSGNPLTTTLSVASSSDVYLMIRKLFTLQNSIIVRVASSEGYETILSDSISTTTFSDSFQIADRTYNYLVKFVAN